MRSITLSPEKWAHYVMEWTHESGFPDEWQRFAERTPVIIECCCGKGDFLAEEAKKYPDKRFIGIDYAEPVMQRAVKRIYESGVENVRFFYNDIHDIIKNISKEISIERIYVNFPDPWPKKRHWNRRIINSEVLLEIHALMSPTTELVMVTDHDGYAEWVCAILEKNTLNFQPIGEKWYCEEMPEFHDSVYMNKARAWGHTFYFFRVKRA